MEGNQMFIILGPKRHKPGAPKGDQHTSVPPS